MHSLGAKEFDKLLKLRGRVCSGGADQAHILAMRCDLAQCARRWGCSLTDTSVWCQRLLRGRFACRRS